MSGEKDLKIASTLVTALLCSLPLLFPSVSRATSPAKWNGTGCFSYRTPRVSNTVCDYGVEQPFVLNGYSKGGVSTLSYAVQCSKNTGAANEAPAGGRSWYKRSFTVKGNFTVYGAKSALLATKHCVSADGVSPILTVALKMGESAIKTNLSIRLDSNLPWGN